MNCYSCAQQGVTRPAVAICRNCCAGLCLDHLHETAIRLAASEIPSTCDHDTWASGAAGPSFAHSS